MAATSYEMRLTLDAESELQALYDHVRCRSRMFEEFDRCPGLGECDCDRVRAECGKAGMLAQSA
jgi:hypothetical protein